MLRSKSHLASTLACALLLAAPAKLAAQDTNALNTLFTQAQASFAAQKYDEAATQLQSLITQAEKLPKAPLELLRFSLGLAYFQAKKFTEAEATFSECAVKHPNGEYTSRCYLGIGRAILEQKNPAKNDKAIQAFTSAANDPKLRAEAGLYLGRLYSDLGKTDEALKVFKSLMGSEVRTPQQTSAAVEAIDLLAQSGKIEDLISYLDRLINQPGVRDAAAWYANQVIIRADQLTAAGKYEAALAIYRSILPRRQLLEVQQISLERQNKNLEALTKRAEAEAKLPIEQRPNTSANDLAEKLKATINSTDEALKAITEKEDLDAALLMRRGRCLYYLNRNEEALICFKYLQDKFPKASDAEHAAYSQIVILNRLKKPDETQKLAAEFIRKYPEAQKREQVALLAGDGLAQAGKWAEVIRFYEGMEKDYASSPSRPLFLLYQGIALFQLNEYADSEKKFKEIVDKYPTSDLIETALYRIAMAHFLTNDYKGTLTAFRNYLTRFPDGEYAGEANYRLAFIDFNNREQDKSDQIIKDLTSFMNTHPEDAATASMYSLIGDVYAQKKKDEQGKPMTDKALEAYLKAAQVATSDQILSYVMDAATNIMQANKDWAGIAKLHSEYYQKHPNTSMGTRSATWVAKMQLRDGKPDGAVKFLVGALQPIIADPANEQVEFLIDELAKTFVPPGKLAREANVEQLCDKLAEVLHQAAAGKENQTTNARIYYGRAKLAQLLRDTERANRYMKGIATAETDPASLSPVLLYVSADLLMKEGNYDQAEGMYRRLADRYKESSFADAGPAGLGQVALARGNNEEALTIFDEILASNSGTSRYADVMIGRLKALVALSKLDEADKLAISLLGDKRAFRGAPTGQILLLSGDIYRKRAEKQIGMEKKESLAKAHGFYQKTYTAYQAFPDVCAEGYWRAYEVAKLLGDNELAANTLKTLAENPKLQKTARAKQAKEQKP